LKTFDQTEHGVCLIWKAGKPTKSPAAGSAESRQLAPTENAIMATQSEDTTYNLEIIDDMCWASFKSGAVQRWR